MLSLDRQTFEVSRAAEYFDRRELQAQTGQPVERFAAVVVKELLDNALDAAEAAGRTPHVILTVDVNAGEYVIQVDDNGAGIPAETVRRILNFDTRTSDKAAYRTPTRGAQGNALKTVLGIPPALGGVEPVIIAAGATRHQVRAWVDPAGLVRVEHEERPREASEGTAVNVCVPAAGQALDPAAWARAFAVFNPHAFVQFAAGAVEGKHPNTGAAPQAGLYKPTAPEGWKKFGPTDLPSPWWFNVEAMKRLIFLHIAEGERQGRQFTLREFVRQFKGLSRSAVTKRICDAFPHVSRLSDFEGRAHLIPALLELMQEEAQAPAPRALGVIGKEHLEARFTEMFGGVRRSWYKRAEETVEGVPFVVEVYLAETEEPGAAFTGVNFSPTFEDPFGRSCLSAGELEAWGVLGYLARAHSLPGRERKLAAAFHLVCPALDFLDRGKSFLAPREELLRSAAATLWPVVRKRYEEEERRRRDAARQGRADQRRELEMDRAARRGECPLREAVFAVIPAAVEKATGGGVLPVSARSLYYQVRAAVQEHTSRDLAYNYFAQTLLVEYQREIGAIGGLYYDPRGVLYEPHTGAAVPLGTRQVEAYRFPAWLYGGILYVEKKGLWPTLQAAQLAERYDLAVVAAEGYATEACRTLFAQADRDRQYQIFVLHDADPAGYDIARTLRHATARMPGYQVDVIDLGLKLEEALELGLATEDFTRRKALPRDLVLSQVERSYFEGRLVRPGRKPQWVARRVELNAFDGPALIAYVEEKLVAAGVKPKVIPDAPALTGLAVDQLRAAVGELVAEEVRRAVNESGLVAAAEGRAAELVSLDGARAALEEELRGRPPVSWREVLARFVDLRLRAHRPALRRLVLEGVREAVGG